MAEAPGASTICPLNILFRDLAQSINEDDVNEMKNLLRGKQVSELEMKELRSAWDVLHHLKNRGDIGVRNLGLLENLFSLMNKEPLKTKVIEFQRKYASITNLDYASTSVPCRGKDSSQTSSEDYHQNRIKSSNQRRLKHCRKEQKDEVSKPVKIRKTGFCHIKAGKTGRQSSFFERRKVQKSLAAARRINFKKRNSKEPTGVTSPKQRRLSDSSRCTSTQCIQSTKDKILRMTGKVSVVIDKIERQSRQLDLAERKMALKERKENLKLRKSLRKLVEKVLNSVPEKDIAKNQECKDVLKEFRAILKETKSGSLVFILSFLTKEDIDYFWQKYKDGTVEKALSRILIPRSISDKALKAGITIGIKLEIDENEYKEVKDKMHEIAAVSTECRVTSPRDTVCGKWEAFVMDQVQDEKQARNLLEQSKFDPVVNALREDKFFYPSLVSFWLHNSFIFPLTVTKATEYAVIHHAQLYCNEVNVKVENLSDILKARFNDIGKCLYDHITVENVGKLYPSWIDKSISNLESQFFGLLTKSDDCYTFPSKYVYSYIIATYLSNIVALSPNNIPMVLREEKTKILQANLSYCFPYVTGILGEKAAYFLKEFVKFSEIQSSVDINNLELVGDCLFESERPSVFARDIEGVIGRNYTLDLSTCKGISNKTIHAMAVMLQYTSLIKDIKLYTENYEAFVSNEFKECLTNIIGDPLSLDRCTVRINNTHDFIVTAKLLRILPLLQKYSKFVSGSEITQQPSVRSLTISSNVSIMEEIEECTMQMFMKGLSFMPHLENLSLTGFGSNLCEQFLLCLSEQTVSLNINTLCLAENELSWNHCRLLRGVLNAMPRLNVLDLSRNSIGSLGCTVLLPIINLIEVRIDDNNIANGLHELLPLCTSTAELLDVGDLFLESLDDVANLIRSLDNVRHIHCTKLMTIQLSKLSENLSLLRNIVSIDLSGTELNQNIVLLLSERMKHLKELERVDLSHCCVSTDDMAVLLHNISQEVTDLNLSNTDMSGHLLNNLKRFRNLKHLNLSNSNLKANDHVFRFIPTSVTHLNLSQNDLHECNSENLENYTQLEKLDVSYNKLSLFDIRKILKLISTSITALNVSHNNLKRTEESFEHLTQLKQLNLSNNGLESCINLSLPSSITHLNLSHNQISYIGRKVNHLLQLTHLNVSHNQIKYIHDCFNNLSQLTHLDVSHNQLVDIGRSFNQLTKLTHLDASHNRIVNIGQGFNRLTQLTHLDMSHNRVNQSLTDILKYLPKTSRYLDFSSNCIENVASVGNVISSFNDLQFINLGSNKFGDIGILNLLNGIKNTDMDKIGVSHNFSLMPHIIDQMPNVAINLEQDNLLSDVESSSIYENLMQVTEVNVKGLSKEKCSEIYKSLILLTNFTKLVMTECCLPNVQNLILSLEHRNALTDLDLSKNQLDSAKLEHIIKYLPSTLISLSLSHNMASREFSLKHLTKLVRLNLSHNNLQLPLHSLLLNIPETLKYLDISFNKIKNVDQVGKLISDFRQLCYINMNSNQVGTVGVQTLLSDIESYDTNCDIDVSHNFLGLQKIMPDIANQLPTSAVLPDFERENLTLKDEHLQVFFKNILKITTVKIQKNFKWSETDYKSVLNDLAVFSNLERLTLVMLNPATCPFLATKLKNFSFLRHLDISGSKIDSQDVKIVGNVLLSLKRLEYINFSNMNIGMSDIEFLLGIHRKHSNHPFINVAHNVHYLPAILPYIKDQLKESSIHGIDANSDELHVQSFANVVQITNLTKLKVKEKRWLDKDFNSFVQGLKYLNLKYLDLSHNNIGDSGAKSLSEGMRSMHGLTHLDLSHNNIEGSGAKNLSEGLRSMHGQFRQMFLISHASNGLTHLNLSHNNIGDSGAKSLSDVMRSMGGLTHLDLSHNNIGDSGAKNLSEELRSMHGQFMQTFLISHARNALTHLNLSHNNIGDSGAKSLSEVMRSMGRLTHLDLSHNNIGDSGAKSLSEVMRSMGRLTHLDLSHNYTQCSAAKSHSEGISSMTSLEKYHAASEKDKATFKSAKASIFYSDQEEHHSKEMLYQKAEQTQQSLLQSSPQPSTSGYVPCTEKDPAKS